jgi:hypothetical protein
MVLLAPPPSGYDYLRIDDDTVLMRRDMRLVTEIITKLNQLMNWTRPPTYA